MHDHRGLSAFYGSPLPDEDRFKVLDRAYELGQTFWDCGY
jgi:aryl-alcohol dehydrogenase-like predicted oxidoreductase